MINDCVDEQIELMSHQRTLEHSHRKEAQDICWQSIIGCISVSANNAKMRYQGKSTANNTFKPISQFLFQTENRRVTKRGK